MNSYILNIFITFKCGYRVYQLRSVPLSKPIKIPHKNIKRRYNMIVSMIKAI